MRKQPADFDLLKSESYIGKLTPSTDFTVYWPQMRRGIPPKVKQLLNKPKQSVSRGSINEQVSLTLPVGKSANARACLCSCYHGRFASGTFRTQKEKPNIDGCSTTDIPWKCSPWSQVDSVTKENEFLIETSDLVDYLWKIIWGDVQSTPPSGLVVFAGSTNSGKSNLAMAFALRAVQHSLLQRKDSKRLPHLISIEDPIESWAVSTRTKMLTPEDPTDTVIALQESPTAASDLNFCFTPREKGTDVVSLKDALNDAKRQTPICVYIGEVRDKTEWQEIIDFAGTGHLVVTTTHAARLNETVARIIQSVDANNPAARRKVGGYLSACVHLQQILIEKETDPLNKRIVRKGLILPTLWKRQGAALSSLVADGLSSITPNNDYVLSRLQLFSKYISQLKDDCENQPKELFAKALDKARDLDIEELLQQ